MGEKKWTSAQSDAISAHGGAILVSAAAGSGKTAVLVERVISKITDAVNPVDADKILIVTFTRAAAAEMKERISERLSQMAEEDRQNAIIKRQQMLLLKANICTVDSFCMDIVSENFQKLGVSPSFHIADEAELSVMRSEALSRVINEVYEENGEVFSNLSEIFGADKNDKRITEMILELYSFISAHPFPEKWLAEKLALYDNNLPIEDTVWGKSVKKGAEEILKYCESTLDGALKLINEYEDLIKNYMPAFLADRESVKKLSDTLRSGSWDDMFRILQNITKAKLGSSRDKEAKEARELLQAKRKAVYAAVDKLRKKFCSSADQCRSDLERTAQFSKAFFSTVSKYIAELQRIKGASNALDFGDIEHLALSLFVKPLDNGYELTPEALKYSEKFEEIMVDEYQDTNETQDLLFRSISKNEKNIFIVGDVKQSIYGFRQAMPYLFLQRKNSFAPFCRTEPLFPACILLDKNFRSRKDVTESVNFFFNTLMTEETGEIDYKSGEALSYGAEYYDASENENTKTEITILDSSEETDDADILEAEYISSRIKQMISEKMQITDPDTHERRDIRAGDVCILLRSTKNHAAKYADTLRKNGFSAECESSAGFFSSAETAWLLSLIRVIDNPTQDIPLSSVMLSPLFGFSPDELAQIRLESKRGSIYSSLLSFRGGNDKKVADFLRKTEMLRYNASNMSVGDFLTYLYSYTSLPDIALSMKDGEKRLLNLHAFWNLGKTYDSFSSNGISGFARYLDKLMEGGTDIQTQDSAGESSDTVKILSIHKSKGLEFPVCIIAGCSRKFNFDTSDALLHMDLGFGIRLRSENKLSKYTTFIREAIDERKRADSAAEELRILYVALTRAKEKLIILSTLSNPASRLSSLSLSFSEDGSVSDYAVRSAQSISHWILLCALQHPDGEKLRELSGSDNIRVVKNNFRKWDISVIKPKESCLIEQESEKMTALPDESFMNELKKEFQYVYPYEELKNIPSKVSASAIAEKESGKRYFQRPSFLLSKGMTPAERGTALHSFMQYCSLRGAEKDSEAEIERLVEEGFITKDEGMVIDREKLQQFLSSGVFKRMLGADRCLREYRFTVEVSANELRESGTDCVNNQKLILQGAFDCLIFENNSVTVIDYKTDRTSDMQGLAKRYSPQLELYKKAAEEIFDSPLKECLIYSFHTGETIKI